jgi:hypothetical protein
VGVGSFPLRPLLFSLSSSLVIPYLALLSLSLSPMGVHVQIFSPPPLDLFILMTNKGAMLCMQGARKRVVVESLPQQHVFKAICIIGVERYTRRAMALYQSNTSPTQQRQMDLLMDEARELRAHTSNQQIKQEF